MEAKNILYRKKMVINNDFQVTKFKFCLPLEILTQGLKADYNGIRPYSCFKDYKIF